MFVAMVTAPMRPAWATISDSRAACSGNAAPLEHFGELDRLVDVRGADQDGSAGIVHVHHFLDNGFPLLGSGPVNYIGVIDSHERLVRRYGNHF
jgi:hypothetical protein